MPGSTASASSNAALLVVGVNWIGDALMSLPALEAWRRAHPASRLILLTKSGLAPLWALSGAPDAVLTYDNAWRAMREAARAIRAAAPARAVIFPNSIRSALPPFWAGVPERIGRAGGGRGWLLTRALPRRRGEATHQSLEYFELLGLPRPTGPCEPPALTIPPDSVERMAERCRALPRPLLAVLPGAARGPAKRWPVRHFAALAARWVADRRGGVLVTGGPADRAAGDAIAAPLGASALNLAGQTSLAEWAAALAACDAVVCNDSGGMHLAAALGRRGVAVFGATDPRVTGPLGRGLQIVQDDGPRARDIARRAAEAEKRLEAIRPERIYEALLHAVQTKDPLP